jgi:HlyD family secretion protein
MRVCEGTVALLAPSVDRSDFHEPQPIVIHTMKARRAQGLVRWIIGSAIVVAAMIGAGAAALHFLRPRVTVTEVVEGPVVQAFYSTGTIQPEREYPIKSNTAGILTDVRVDKGARVRKGDALAIVTDPVLIYAADKAKAELDEKLKRADERTSPVLQEYDAKIAAMGQMLDIATREEKRLRDILERDAATRFDLDRATDRVKSTWSELETFKAQRASKLLELQREVEVARSASNTAQWNLEQQTLKSPIDGVVLDRPTSLGTRVAVNDAIMRVADVRPENLVMRAAVDEEDVVKVRAAQVVKMTLYAFDNTVFTGQVTKIYDQADPERRTYEVDVRLEKPDDKLSPGMTGELAFVISARDKAMVVPSQALQGGVVYAVDANDVVRRADVTVGLKSVERVEIVSGLKLGDRVIITPIGDTKPGQHVRTSYQDPATAAGVNKPKAVTDNFKGFN